jgi:hypothetical protein
MGTGSRLYISRVITTITFAAILVATYWLALEVVKVELPMQRDTIIKRT